MEPDNNKSQAPNLGDCNKEFSLIFDFDSWLVCYISSYKELKYGVTTEMNQSIMQVQPTIKTELEGIAEAVRESKSDSDIWVAFLVALIGALSGSIFAYIFTRMHWRHTRTSDHLLSIKKSMINTLHKLEEDAWQYWVSIELSSADKIRLESSLEVRMKPLYRYSRVLEENIEIKDPSHSKKWVIALKNNKKTGFCTLDQLFDIYDLATSWESYEDGKKKVDVGKAMLISQKCHSLIAKLECMSC